MSYILIHCPQLHRVEPYSVKGHYQFSPRWEKTPVPNPASEVNVLCTDADVPDGHAPTFLIHDTAFIQGEGPAAPHCGHHTQARGRASQSSPVKHEPTPQLLSTAGPSYPQNAEVVQAAEMLAHAEYDEDSPALAPDTTSGKRKGSPAAPPKSKRTSPCKLDSKAAAK